MFTTDVYIKIYSELFHNLTHFELTFPISYKLALFHVLQSRLLFVTYGKTCLFLQNGRQINSSNICALTLVVTPVFIHFEKNMYVTLWEC